MTYKDISASGFFYVFLLSLFLLSTSALKAQNIVVENDSLGFLAPDTAAVGKNTVAIENDTLFTESDTLFTESDTLAVIPPLAAADDSSDPTHKVRLAEWIIPGAVAVGGALCVNSKWGYKFRRWVQNGISQKGEHKVWADDYMQYAPAVAVYALDLCGVKAQHTFLDRTIILAMSMATMAIVTNVAKYSFREMRPDGTLRNSFPSGHTATAFMGAEFLWQEYRHTHPWIGYTCYAIAAGVGYLRVHNNRHWATDVLAGAAVGMLSTKFAYWLYPKIFKEHKRKQKLTAFGMPYYSGDSAGVSVAMRF